MPVNATDGTFTLPDLSSFWKDFSINEIWGNVVQFVLHQGLRILIIVLLYLFLSRLAKLSLEHGFRILKIKKDPEHAKRLETLHTVTRITAKGGLIVLAVVLVLGELGISLGPLLATAGVVGIAVGFGAQHLVQDILSGFFLLLDDQIRVGDVVRLGDKAGVVELINLRLTVLRDQDGSVHYIPNGQISIVTNLTKEYSYFLMDLGVAYREDADEVMRVIKDVAEELRQDEIFAPDILEPMEMLGLDKFADSSVVIRARIKTRPIRQWAVGREMNRRLKRRFDELGIEIPFPQVTLWPGVDKEGRAPALKVRALVRAEKEDPAPHRQTPHEESAVPPTPADVGSGEEKDSREVKEKKAEEELAGKR